jgi:hypothetical protein
MYVRVIEFTYFYDFSIECWNCSDSVIYIFSSYYRLWKKPSWVAIQALKLLLIGGIFWTFYLAFAALLQCFMHQIYTWIFVRQIKTLVALYVQKIPPISRSLSACLVWQIFTKYSKMLWYWNIRFLKAFHIHFWHAKTDLCKLYQCRESLGQR